jgi:CheY-like chemotaxis protein
MTFSALLISEDDDAAGVLTSVLSGLGGTVVRCGHAEAANRLMRERFAAVLVDFDDSLRTSRILRDAQQASAGLILHRAQQAIPGFRAITIALLRQPADVRKILNAGANFILYKPVSADRAKAALRAVSALIKRDRRQAYRVPVQVPVEVNATTGPAKEGILLDLSGDGLDILLPQPAASSRGMRLRFTLPQSEIVIDAYVQVAWASPNGETGVRFVTVVDDMRQALHAWLAANKRELPPLDAEEIAACKLTDLSLGACYVETESPFPEKSAITLCLKAEDFVTELEGTVRVMHPGFGMGVEFSRKTMEDRARVTNFIGFLNACPETKPELSVIPRALVAPIHPAASDEESRFALELHDPLLDLLQHPERLTSEEFLRQMRRQRNPVAVGAS